MTSTELIVIILVSFVSGCYAMYKFLQPRLHQTKLQPLRPLDFVQAVEIIKRMNATINRLKSVEDLLTSSQLCNSEHSQNIKCSWSNDKDSYTFSVNESQNHFVELAQTERIKLRSSLSSDVDALCELRRYGVTKTITLTHNDTRGEG